MQQFLQSSETLIPKASHFVCSSVYGSSSVWQAAEFGATQACPCLQMNVPWAGHGVKQFCFLVFIRILCKFSTEANDSMALQCTLSLTCAINRFTLWVSVAFFGQGDSGGIASSKTAVDSQNHTFHHTGRLTRFIFAGGTQCDLMTPKVIPHLYCAVYLMLTPILLSHGLQSRKVTVKCSNSVLAQQFLFPAVLYFAKCAAHFFFEEETWLWFWTLRLSGKVQNRTAAQMIAVEQSSFCKSW